mmetsp:Transcript_49229/g.119305  ORF Transcript_49229/g.119305 Transcript_49229/m.119305 type:complete len:98 (+) Transcript_49229:70-363(+)
MIKHHITCQSSSSFMKKTKTKKQSRAGQFPSRSWPGGHLSRVVAQVRAAVLLSSRLVSFSIPHLFSQKILAVTTVSRPSFFELHQQHTHTHTHTRSN